MKIYLITRLMLIGMLSALVFIPIACSSDDGGTPPVDMTPDPDPDPDPVPDPTNGNTVLEAGEETNMNGTSSVTITVKIADTNGNPMTTSSGTVTLEATGSAIISEVTDNGNGTYTATASNMVDETVTVSGALDNTAITNTVLVVFNPDESNPAQEAEQSTEELGPSILRINSGGPEVTFGDITFLEDQYFGEGTEAYTNPFVTEIANTDMDAIYLTERITDNENIRGPIAYNIPISNGTYTVKLYFAEIFWGVENPEMREGGIGSRIFNIGIEDTQVFSGYDLFKEHGAASAGTRMYDIEVTDGELTINLEAPVDKPKLSAIEVFGEGTIGN